MDHQHRAIRRLARDRAWQGCVAPDRCPGERTHGNIVRIDLCSCGATRLSERAAGHAVYADWKEAKEAGVNVVGKIIAYENGEMNHEEVVEFFRELGESGVIHSLQGSYQRTYQALADAGEL